MYSNSISLIQLSRKLNNVFHAWMGGVTLRNSSAPLPKDPSKLFVTAVVSDYNSPQKNICVYINHHEPVGNAKYGLEIRHSDANATSENFEMKLIQSFNGKVNEFAIADADKLTNTIPMPSEVVAIMGMVSRSVSEHLININTINGLLKQVPSEHSMA